MSTPLHTPSTTGRRGTGAPTPGRQRAQPHRHATGRRAAADPQHPVVSVHRPSAAPQRGGHCERHSPDRATGPTSGGRDPGPHPRQPSGPRRRNRLASEWEQRLRLDFQHPHRTLLPAAGSGQGGGGRSAGRVILRSTGQRLLRRLPPLRWPQATVLGPPVAGYPRPGGALPQGHRAGPVGRGSPSGLCRGQVYVEARSMSRPGLCRGQVYVEARSMSRPGLCRGQVYVEARSMSRPGLCRGQVYVEARSFTHPQAQRRRTAQLAWERQLLVIGQPFLADPLALQGRLCRRIERHIKELFVFVAEPDVPSDNNPAERSLRHLVISRKVSGGTRSERGTESKMTLASVFGTWRAQGLNPLAACRQLLTSPKSELLPTRVSHLMPPHLNKPVTVARGLSVDHTVTLVNSHRADVGIGFQNASNPPAYRIQRRLT